MTLGREQGRDLLGLADSVGISAASDHRTELPMEWQGLADGVTSPPRSAREEHANRAASSRVPPHDELEGLKLLVGFNELEPASQRDAAVILSAADNASDSNVLEHDVRRMEGFQCRLTTWSSAARRFWRVRWNDGLGGVA